ncbi:MAG: AmmeMemoRadiSam system protein B [Myxococcales bacterium]|nr:AmmeMemoRadiSam system protein B [Myxococcales bacterium]
MEIATERAPAVAGRFYPGDAEGLQRAVDHLVDPGAAIEPVPALALMAPHAGYVYSGALAGQTWARAEVPDRVVLLCPNHTGYGVPRSIWTRGRWALPGGGLEVDAELARAILTRARLEEDRDAHRYEHAIEVQLPFVRARQPAAKIVPICLAGLSVGECREIGEGIAAAIEALGEPVLVAASSDMSHYIAADEARVRDRLALDRLLALDPAGLYNVVRAKGITMCGYLPATVALYAALAQGARHAELVGYTNSGEVSGDFERVVGYAGALVTR